MTGPYKLFLFLTAFSAPLAFAGEDQFRTVIHSEAPRFSNAGIKIGVTCPVNGFSKLKIYSFSFLGRRTYLGELSAEVVAVSDTTEMLISDTAQAKLVIAINRSDSVTLAPFYYNTSVALEWPGTLEVKSEFNSQEFNPAHARFEGAASSIDGRLVTCP
jgi:hypothetical protein